MIQKYLVIEQEVFIDPHGSADETEAVSKYIVDDARYLERNGKFIQHDEIVGEDDLQASEDGYNSTASSYTVRAITDEEATNFANVIEAYNKIA